MLRRRRLEDTKHVNHERWLLTYSDLITLLLIFFVVMFSMSTVNQEKYRQLANTLKQSMNHQETNAKTTGQYNNLQPGSPTNAGTAKLNQPPANLDSLYAQITAYIRQHHLEAEMSVINQQRGVQVTLTGVAFFDTGSARIRLDALNKLAGLVPLFKSLPNDIVVEGYTDNQPIHTALYPSNWELSAMRALSMVHYLIGQGIAPSRLSEVGYGEERPIAPNNSNANRQKNRRVNIVILRANPTLSQESVGSVGP